MKKSIILLSITLITIFLMKNIPEAYAQEPVSNNSTSKVIYMTFDDGPSDHITPKILDILKQKKVKATFFIVGKCINGKEDILRRIYNEGHGIGLHSYSHNSKKIYKSTDALIKEMDETKVEIHNVIGTYTYIVRLPGGSKSHLNADSLEALHSHKYKLYDWNACISDGIDYNIKCERLIREAKKVVGNSNKIMLLLHCDECNKNTVKALPSIIDYYIDKNYEFKIIDKNTPEYYFRL